MKPTPPPDVPSSPSFRPGRTTAAVLLFLATVLLTAACDSDAGPTRGEPRTEGGGSPPSDVEETPSDSRATSGATSHKSDGSNGSGLAQLHLLALRDAGRLDRLASEEVAIADGPVYDGTARFRAWPLPELLDLLPDEAIPETDEDRRRLLLQFVATDGYRASALWSELPLERGWVAHRDLDASDSSRWRPFPDDPSKTPGPFYLVWQDASAFDGHLPWAYKVVEIRVDRLDDLYGPAVPSPTAESTAEAADDHRDVRRGFDLVRRRCLSCHSVNRVGGDVGPELNVPMNVTEYWREDHLRAFITDPSSYRAGTEMPTFDGLGTGQIDAILAYLRAMADQKICDSKATCAE